MSTPPKKMPTENIRMFITSAKLKRDEWARDAARLAKSLKVARGAQLRAIEDVLEYEGWLNHRLEEENA